MADDVTVAGRYASGERSPPPQEADTGQQTMTNRVARRTPKQLRALPPTVQGEAAPEVWPTVVPSN